MYFPTSATVIEFLILAIVDKDDSYGYAISQTIKQIANIKESTLHDCSITYGSCPFNERYLCKLIVRTSCEKSF